MLRAWSPRAARRSRVRPGRRAGVIGLLAAAFVVAGATGSLQGLYLFLAGPFDLPWHRGVELNLSQVVDGYRVTIDRAYADSTRLALAISVVDELERDGTTQLMAMSTIVTDASGEYSSGGGAVSRPDGPFAAVNVAWKQPPVLPLPAGPRQLHVVAPVHHGPRRLDASARRRQRRLGPVAPLPRAMDIRLRVERGRRHDDHPGGRHRDRRCPGRRDAPDRRLEHRPGRDAVEGSLPAGDWTPVGEVRHGGRTLGFVVASLGSDGTIALMTDGGVGDASGEWTVTVDELVGGDVRLAGPWVLRFDAP